jgi:poly [ADP-ribose] polymerase 10/14/15
MAFTFWAAVSEFYAKSKPSHLQLIRVTIFQSTMANEFVATLSASCPAAGQVRHRGTMEHQSVYVEGGRAGRLVLCVFGLSQSVIDTVVKEIDELAKHDTRDETIENHLIAELSDEQIAHIYELCDELGVTGNVNRGKYVHCIHLRGSVGDVLTAKEKINAIIQKKELEHRRKIEIELISKTVQWEFEVDGHYEAYPAEINAIIEKAYMDQRPSAMWEEVDGKYEINFEGKYNINFATYIESCSTAAGSQVKVRRVGEVPIKLPQCWEKMNDTEPVRKVRVTTGTQEFLDVERNVMATASGTVNEMEIYRIQNPALYRQYALHKAHMEHNKPTGVICERILWHGTKSDLTDQINAGGFNRTYCGRNATLYGLGVYFALNWTYSAQERYSPIDNDGWKFIYQVRALTGEYTKGNKDMKEPPFKPKTNIRFDSAVDDINAPEIFVLFHDAEAYPEYLIRFNQKAVANQAS